MVSNCQNCGYELNGVAFCPRCGTKAEAAKIPVVEEVAVTAGGKVDNIHVTSAGKCDDVPVAAPEISANSSYATPVPQQRQFSQSVPQTQPYNQPMTQQYNQPAAQTFPQQYQQNLNYYCQPQAQPSVAGQTFKNTFMCFRHFFSKNAEKNLTMQYIEKTNIWIVLFTLTALLSAISCGIHHCSIATDLIGITDMPYALTYTFFGDFFIGLGLMAAFEFIFVMAIFLYSRAVKKSPLTFRSCGNMVAAAIVPLSIVAGSYVFMGVYTGLLNIIGLLMFTHILKKSMDKAFGENGENFWSFFIVLAIAVTAFMIVSAIFSIPGWLMNAYTNTISFGTSELIDPYVW